MCAFVVNAFSNFPVTFIRQASLRRVSFVLLHSCVLMNRDILFAYRRRRTI
jgi:hypothetical protein